MKECKTFGSRLWVCAAAIAVTLVSCAPAVTLTGTWKAPASTSVKFSHVLVVAIGKDLAKRTLGENMLARELNETGIPAATSLTVFTPAFAAAFDSVTVQQQLKEKGFDGVLTIRVLSIDEQQRWMPGYDAPYYYGGFYRYYYRYGQYGYGRPVTEVRVLLESNLYDLRTGTLLWTGQSVSISRDPTKQMARQYAKNVVGDLLDKKVIAL